MIDYIKLLEQEPEIKAQVIDIVFETIISANPQIVQLIYTMLNAGISKEQIVIVIKNQMKEYK